MTLNKYIQLLEKALDGPYYKIYTNYILSLKGDADTILALCFICNLLHLKSNNMQDRKLLIKRGFWFKCPAKLIQKKLAFARTKQRRVIKKLQQLGLIDTKRSWKNRLWIRINSVALKQFVTNSIRDESSPLRRRKPSPLEKTETVPSHITKNLTSKKQSLRDCRCASPEVDSCLNDRTQEREECRSPVGNGASMGIKERRSPAKARRNSAVLVKYPFLADWAEQLRDNVRLRCRVKPSWQRNVWINCLGQFVDSCEGDVPRAERIFRSCLAHNANGGPKITHPKHLSAQVVTWLEDLADRKESSVWTERLVAALLKFMAKHDPGCPSTAADWTKALDRLGKDNDRKRVEAVVDWLPGNTWPEHFEPRIKTAGHFRNLFDALESKMREEIQ